MKRNAEEEEEEEEEKEEEGSLYCQYVSRKVWLESMKNEMPVKLFQKCFPFLDSIGRKIEPLLIQLKHYKSLFEDLKDNVNNILPDTYTYFETNRGTILEDIEAPYDEEREEFIKILNKSKDDMNSDLKAYRDGCEYYHLFKCHTPLNDHLIDLIIEYSNNIWDFESIMDSL